jgi:alanine racemase
MKRPVWAEIDLKALAGNVREIRRVTDESAQIMAIVKANGYGHGVEHVSRVALQNGASWIGVALLQEAILLREKGIKAPILVLGYTPVDDIAEVIRYDISQTVFTWDDALAIASVANHLGKKAKIHVKIDTGMGRLGFKWDRETLDIICRLAHLPGLEVEGIYTHFATADGDDKTFAQEQFARFQQILKQLAARHVFIRWRHCANSAAVMSMPFTHLDLVRPGITIYGLYPSSNSRDLVPDALKVIFTDAFQAQAGFGALIGTTIRYGVARGVFSNEAGLGSAPIAAAAAKTDHPCRQALVSMTGTFLDTIIVCSITGILLVMAGLYPDFSEGTAVVLTSCSFDFFLPGIGSYIVTVGLILFAYSTVLGWFYYGEKCFYYLTGFKGIKPYRMLFCLMIFVGAVLKIGLVWDIADAFNGAMAIPNLVGLLALSSIVVSETREFQKIREKEKGKLI